MERLLNKQQTLGFKKPYKVFLKNLLFCTRILTPSYQSMKEKISEIKWHIKINFFVFFM